jgi:hypothetical protein
MFRACLGFSSRHKFSITLGSLGSTASKTNESSDAVLDRGDGSAVFIVWIDDHLQRHAAGLKAARPLMLRAIAAAPFSSVPLFPSERRRKGMGIGVMRNPDKRFVIGSPPRDNPKIWTHWKFRRRDGLRSCLT